MGGPVREITAVIAVLLPLTLVALHDMGGWSGLQQRIAQHVTERRRERER